jgi:hypothetical protein
VGQAKGGGAEGEWGGGVGYGGSDDVGGGFGAGFVLEMRVVIWRKAGASAPESWERRRKERRERR